jgi:hypothetical protein
MTSSARSSLCPGPVAWIASNAARCRDGAFPFTNGNSPIPGRRLPPAMYCAVSRQDRAASAVTTAPSMPTSPSMALTWVTLVVSSALSPVHLLARGNYSSNVNSLVIIRMAGGVSNMIGIVLAGDRANQESGRLKRVII